MEQYSRRNNVAVSDISNKLSDENIEEKVIEVFKEVGIDLKLYDIEACHRLTSELVNTSTSKRVIVKIVKRDYSEVMLCLKNK